MGGLPVAAGNGNRQHQPGGNTKTRLAAKTSRIQLGTGAIILPWWQGDNEPIRLAERISMLDALSDGRLLLGFGRGLAKDE